MTKQYCCHSNVGLMFTHVLCEVPFSYNFCYMLVKSSDLAKRLALEWTGTQASFSHSVSGCLGPIVYPLIFPG